jgi:hypothetical protein
MGLSPEAAEGSSGDLGREAAKGRRSPGLQRPGRECLKVSGAEAPHPCSDRTPISPSSRARIASAAEWLPAAVVK